MSVKDDRTKFLLKLLIPRSSSVKAVSVYLKQKLKEQFVMFPPEIMPCACCWSVRNHKDFLGWRRFAQWKLS